MLGRVHAKLKSNTGASLLIALIFFLLCAVCGAVVLTAGTASSGRIAGLAESEQDYYSVTSAAQVIKAELKELKFQVETEETETSAGIVSDIVSARFISGGYLNGILEEPLSRISKGEITAYSDDSLEFTLTPEEEAIGTVKGTLMIDSDYHIELLLMTDSNKYSCKIAADASTDVQTMTDGAGADESTKKTTYITTITWDGPVISKSWIEEQTDREEEVVS